MTTTTNAGPTSDQINQIFSAYQGGDYSTAGNLANQFGLTSSDLSQIAPSFDQSVLANQGIVLPGGIAQLGAQGAAASAANQAANQAASNAVNTSAAISSLNSQNLDVNQNQISGQGNTNTTPLYSVNSSAPGYNANAFYGNLANVNPNAAYTSADDAVLARLKSELGGTDLGGTLKSYAAINNDPTTANNIATQLANAQSPTEFLNILKTSDPTGQNLYSQMLSVATDAYATTSKTASDYTNAASSLSAEAGRNIMPGANTGVSMTTGTSAPGAFQTPADYYNALVAANQPSTTSTTPVNTSDFADWYKQFVACAGTKNKDGSVTPPPVPQGYSSWAQVYNDLYQQPNQQIAQAQATSKLEQTNPNQVGINAQQNFYAPQTNLQKVQQQYGTLLPSTAQVGPVSIQANEIPSGSVDAIHYNPTTGQFGTTAYSSVNQNSNFSNAITPDVLQNLINSNTDSSIIFQDPNLSDQQKIDLTNGSATAKPIYSGTQSPGSNISNFVGSVLTYSDGSTYNTQTGVKTGPSTGGISSLGNQNTQTQNTANAGIANINQDQATQVAQAYAAAQKSGDYSQVQNLVNQLGVNGADVSKFFPSFDTSKLGSNVFLAGTPQAQQDFVNQLKSIATNPTTTTSSQIQDLITRAQNDPTLAQTYATQIQTLQAALPTYQAQDAITQAQSGTNVLQNYQNLLNIAQTDPTVASALGSTTLTGIQDALQASGNGKYISTFEALTGLDKNIQSQVPAQLDTTKLPQGVTQNDDGTYQVQVPTPAGWDPGTHVFATYDQTGALTGYYSPNPVFPTDANGNMSNLKYDASWTANGAPTPQLDTSHGGVVSNFVQGMGPLGGLAIGAALSALTGGIAAPLSDALTGALGSTLGAAATQGVLTGGLSSLLGGKFSTGFEAGALGSGITQGLNAIPGIPATASQYYTKPIGNALASSLVTGTPVGTNLANAAISGGLNQSLNNVPGLDAKTAGVIANLLPSIMTGKLNPASLVGVASNLQKATS
jgi:hypothetical protein